MNTRYGYAARLDGGELYAHRQVQQRRADSRVRGEENIAHCSTFLAQCCVVSKYAFAAVSTGDLYAVYTAWDCQQRTPYDLSRIVLVRTARPILAEHGVRYGTWRAARGFRDLKLRNVWASGAVMAAPASSEAAQWHAKQAAPLVVPVAVKGPWVPGLPGVVSEFIRDCCAIEPGGMTWSDEVYRAYADWTVDSSEARVMTQRALITMIKPALAGQGVRYGSQRRGSAVKRGFRGLTVRGGGDV